jgi:hypothetical protein
MVSSGMLCRVDLVRTDVSEDPSALVFLCSVHRLLVTANVVLSSPILVILMMEALLSPETSVLTRVTQRNIPEDCIQFLMKHSMLAGSYWGLSSGRPCWDHC